MPVSSNRNTLDVSKTPATIDARMTNCTNKVTATNAEAARKPTTKPTPIPADGTSVPSAVVLATDQGCRHNNHANRESLDTSPDSHNIRRYTPLKLTPASFQWSRNTGPARYA